MKHEEFFRKHPVFTARELTEHLSTSGGVGPRTREALLSYHKKRGRIVPVRRGLYAVIPPGADPDSYPVDLVLIAAKLAKDAVLSHHTALEFHGRAYSLYEHYTYSASRPLKSVTFRSHVFSGVKFPKALHLAGKEDYGVSIVDRAGLKVRVTSLERTLVDVLNRPDISGSWEEIWRSLESVEFFDLDKVVEYVYLLKNATTAMKVGFFLEQNRESLMVEDRFLDPLQELRPQQPHYLDRNKRTSGRLISKWNLIIPIEILERAWGEVL